MSKKGFTLIELLGVIILLSLIVALVLPSITNSVNNKNDDIDKVTKNIIENAAKLYVSENAFPKSNENTYCIKLTTLIEHKFLKDSIQYKNQDITNTKVVKLTYDNGYNYQLVNKDSCISSIKLDSVCVYQDNGVAEKTAGAKYNCKVDPKKESYTFYVLTTPQSTDESINLIMDRNINSDGTPVTKAIVKENAENGVYNLVAWVSKEDYNDDTNYETSGNNNKGPITAMNFLSEATKTWINTNEMIINSFTDDTGASYDMQTYNTYARMPHYSEVSNYDSANKTNAYLYDYLILNDGIQVNSISGIYGYWTLSAHSTYGYDARYVRYNGVVYSSSVGFDTDFGVRPVINLKL